MTNKGLSMGKFVYLPRGFTHNVVFISDKKAWKKWAKRLKLPKSERDWPARDFMAIVGRVRNTKTSIDTIYVAFNPIMHKGHDKREILLTLCHESVHVFSRIVDMMNDSEPSEEFAAYTVEWIFAYLMEAYERTSGKKWKL